MAMLALPARLTCDEAAAELRRLQSVLAAEPAGRTVRLDASALAQFDSSAVALLLDLQRQAQQRSLAFTIVAAPQRLSDLARVYGVLGLLQLEAQAPAAA
ncbi:MAG: STAS domain-containing protein [Burkholderiales bacterium]|jgi:phospholipid transport system transporter-binding protein|nr:STAS domain-containing protein [Burkholderiales bacterium]MBP7518982.1 STAS domain-containing protein [Leptothrix sp. (in: b-proteobacteria)]HQY09980.1 STAS domain-containing protein [Burkholderiaceae bacterium]